MKTLILLCIGLFFTTSLLAKWSAGVATIVPASPYVGIETDVRVLPILSYQGERITWRGPSVSYKLTGLQRGTPSFSLNLGLAPNRLETDDSNLLTGINDRDFSFMLGGTYSHPFDFANLSVSIETDISNTHQGHRAVIGGQKTLLADKQRRWAINLGAELEYLSADYADYYFGVDAAEAANSVFSSYQAGSVTQPGLTLGGYFQINQQWNIVANMRWQALSADVKDSPIVTDSSNLNGFFGVLYAF